MKYWLEIYFLLLLSYTSVLFKQHQVSLVKKCSTARNFYHICRKNFFRCPKCILNILIHADMLMHGDTPPVAAFLKSRILALCQELLLGFY